MCNEPSGYTHRTYRLQSVKQLNELSLKEHFIAAVTEVKQLDTNGLLMSTPNRLGLDDTFWRLQHTWVDTPTGVVINSSQVVGVERPGWRPIWFARLRNAIVRGKFKKAVGNPSDMLEQWIRHCVEEFGNLEHILPSLYAQGAKTASGLGDVISHNILETSMTQAAEDASYAAKMIREQNCNLLQSEVCSGADVPDES
eukprot:gene7167-7381_t